MEVKYNNNNEKLLGNALKLMVLAWSQRLRTVILKRLFIMGKINLFVIFNHLYLCINMSGWVSFYLGRRKGLVYIKNFIMTFNQKYLDQY